MVRPITVAGRSIGPGAPCFVIAEAGVNHNGNMGTARRLVEVASQAGADAIKFQTFSADKLATPDAPKAAYQQKTTPSEQSQLEMLRALEFKASDHEGIQDYCRELGILFMSTPFEEDSADFLDTLGVPAFKLPSGELTNLPFLAHVARKGKPLILSTGMSSLNEVEKAVATIVDAGNPDIVLLHCVSNYPAEPRDVNLRAMATMARAFNLPVGFSDHTLGTEIAFAAVALGACVVEKHFTLSRQQPGPDHQASLEPDDLAEMVSGIRRVEAALGGGRKEPAASEGGSAAAVRKSLIASTNISPGTVLTEDLIAIKRPGTGLPPAMRSHVVGRTARVAIPGGTVIALEMLS